MREATAIVASRNRDAILSAWRTEAMRAIKLGAISAFALAACAGIAFAQDAYVVEDDDAYVEYPGAVEYPDDYTEPGIVVGPRVYGWVRPDDCGEFKYWNGDECVDARYDSDDVGD
jgi:hypothetical protein